MTEIKKFKGKVRRIKTNNAPCIQQRAYILLKIGLATKTVRFFNFATKIVRYLKKLSKTPLNPVFPSKNRIKMLFCTAFLLKNGVVFSKIQTHNYKCNKNRPLFCNKMSPLFV